MTVTPAHTEPRQITRFRTGTGPLPVLQTRPDRRHFRAGRQAIGGTSPDAPRTPRA